MMIVSTTTPMHERQPTTQHTITNSGAIGATKYIHQRALGGSGSAAPSLALGHRNASWNAKHGNNNLDKQQQTYVSIHDLTPLSLSLTLSLVRCLQLIPISPIRFHPEYDWFHHRHTSDNDAANRSDGYGIVVEQIHASNTQCHVCRSGVALVIAIASHHVEKPQNIAQDAHNHSLSMYNAAA
jgi:hypothetical protein